MNRQPRRKSLLSQQAELAGMSFSGREARPHVATRTDARRLGALPEYTTPICRPGGSSAGSSRGLNRSRIPSAARVKATRGGMGSGPALPPSGAARPRFEPQNGMGSRSNSVTNLHQNGSRPVMKQPLPHTTMRRSMSMESFAPMSANRTALVTPRNRGESPGFGSVTRATCVTSCVKIPNNKLPAATDKQTITSIIDVITTTLSSLKYGQELTLATFRRLSGKDLQNIIMFLIGYLVGPNEGKKKKDDSIYIIDSLSLLNSPISISKSLLKNLNTNHTLPQVYTLIAWLCCVISSFETDSGNNVARNLDFECGPDDIEDLAWEFCQNLFLQDDTATTINWEAELNNFRLKLNEALSIESQDSLNELQEQIQEKVQALDALLGLEDPRADVMKTLKTQEEIVGQSNKRIADLTDSLQKLTDLTAVETEITVVQSDLGRKTKQLQNLKQAVTQQQITKEKAELLVTEVTNIRKQQDLLKKMISELEQKQKKEEQFLENNMKRFYQVCGTFSIVESYNNAAKMFQEKFPQMDSNPFDIDKMETWITETKAKLGNSMGYLRQEAKKFSDNLKSTERNLMDLDSQIDALQEEFERKSTELSFQMHEQAGRADQLNAEINSKKDSLQAAKNELKKLMDEQHAVTAEIQVLTSRHEEWDNYLAELTEYNTDLEAKVEDQYVVHSTAEEEIKLDIQAFVTEARQQVYAPITELDDPNV